MFQTEDSRTLARKQYFTPTLLGFLHVDVMGRFGCLLPEEPVKFLGLNHTARPQPTPSGNRQATTAPHIPGVPVFASGADSARTVLGLKVELVR